MLLISLSLKLHVHEQIEKKKITAANIIVKLANTLLAISIKKLMFLSVVFVYNTCFRCDCFWFTVIKLFSNICINKMLHLINGISNTINHGY